MAGPSENLGEISTGLGDVSCTLGDSAHMVDHMSQTPNETETATKHTDDGLAGYEDGDLDTGFEQIGFLVTRVLSSAVQARKEREEANAAASSLSFAQASLGGLEEVASNSVIRLDVRARIKRSGITMGGHANENFTAEKQIK